MSEAQMSVEGRQQLADMRKRLAEEQEPTRFVFHLDANDILELMGGYVNLKVRGMCALCLATEDQDQRRADRPTTRTKSTKGMRASHR